MNKKLFTAMLVLGGAALFGQEIADLTGTKKNDKGEYVNKHSFGMYATLRFSEALKPGYYSMTCEFSNNFPTVFWATGTGTTGSYYTCAPVDAAQKMLYYFKVTDFSQMAFRVVAQVPKGNKKQVNFAAKDFKLAALNEIPENMFPEFQTVLKAAPDGARFIYCFSDSKSALITKTTKDGIPVMSIEGNSDKQYNSIGTTLGFPVTNAGKLTVKFTAKSAGGSKQMFVLVRDNFWKKGGNRKNFTLTNDWADYTFELDCAKKFKDGIVLAVADCRFGQGIYLFKDFSVTYKK